MAKIGSLVFAIQIVWVIIRLIGKVGLRQATLRISGATAQYRAEEEAATEQYAREMANLALRRKEAIAAMLASGEDLDRHGSLAEVEYHADVWMDLGRQVAETKAAASRQASVARLERLLGLGAS